MRSAVVLLFGLVAWTVTASGIYCLGTGQLDRFTPPFVQWWQVLPWWRANWWVETWVIVGALVPSAIGLLVGIRRLRRERPLLYGQTEWASPREIARGGFGLRRDL